MKSAIGLAFLATLSGIVVGVGCVGSESSSQGTVEGGSGGTASGTGTAGEGGMGTSSGSSSGQSSSGDSGTGSSSGADTGTDAPVVTNDDYTISVSPAALFLDPSGMGSITVTVTRKAGFTGTIIVTVTGLPSNGTITAQPLTITSNDTTGTLTFQATASATVGSSPIVVTATSGSDVATQDATISIVAPGAVDPSFGSNATLDFTTAGGFFPLGVVIQRNGAIAVGGYVPTASGAQAAVVRFTADGVLDTTYNQTGMSVLGPVGSTAGPASPPPDGAVTIEPDPTTPTNDDVIVGMMTSDKLGFQVTRFTQAGALDTGFNSTGTATHAIESAGTGNGTVALNALAVDSAGNVYAAGSDFGGQLACDIINGVVVGFSKAGALHTVWTNGSVAVSGAGGQTNIYALATLTSQATTLVAVGDNLTTSGPVDFQTWGITTNVTDTVTPFAAGPASQANGSLSAASDPRTGGGVLAAFTNNGEFGVSVLRVTAAGALDTAFNGGHPATTSVTGMDSPSVYGGMAVQADGSALVEINAGASPTKIAVARYTPGGVADGTFGSSAQTPPGVTLDVFGNTTSYAGSGLALQPDGRIVVCASYSGATLDGGAGTLSHVTCKRLFH